MLYWRSITALKQQFWNPNLRKYNCRKLSTQHHY